jgi:hypothetical protein
MITTVPRIAIGNEITFTKTSWTFLRKEEIPISTPLAVDL